MAALVGLLELLCQQLLYFQHNNVVHEQVASILNTRARGSRGRHRHRSRFVTRVTAFKTHLHTNAVCVVFWPYRVHAISLFFFLCIQTRRLACELRLQHTAAVGRRFYLLERTRARSPLTPPIIIRVRKKKY